MSKFVFAFIICFLCCIIVIAQPPKGIHWNKDGKSFYSSESGEIVQYILPSFTKKIIADRNKLTPSPSSMPLKVRNFFFSDDDKKILIYTNSKTVWRYDTRGDYWILNLDNNKLSQVGKTLPASSLMFAKFSPDATKVAFVSGHNIYVQDIATNEMKQLTFDGTRELINGTFDWAYEEEFFCRDGFRWSPDSKQIAYWQIDAKGTKEYLMIDNTDSLYPFVKPVEYPVAGEPPSPFKIGVLNIATAKTKWMNIPTDPVRRSYVPRMEWAHNNNELIIQHLNRKQNQSDIMLCNVATGKSTTIYEEKDSAWIDILPLWDEDYDYGGWDWLNNGN
ncbi:MAG TPA: DPP IV N-terminal domain-containing protein, partial [Chitinophagaceae bacterium]|nr:DPP IV N-terminal domain-containing protein [Chitinophagaceae bacterium]